MEHGGAAALVQAEDAAAVGPPWAHSGTTVEQPFLHKLCTQQMPKLLKSSYLLPIRISLKHFLKYVAKAIW